MREEDSKLVSWKLKGEILATWGEIPVCRCKVQMLGERFKELLARDKSALKDLETFLGNLGSE